MLLRVLPLMILFLTVPKLKSLQRTMAKRTGTMRPKLFPGEKAEKNPEPVVYALRHGMIVGNHGYSHPAFSQLSLEEGILEIEKTEKILNHIYEMAGVERRFRPFRFPYGDKGGQNREQLQAYLREGVYTPKA